MGDYKNQYLVAQNVKVCEIDPEVKEKLRKFRFRKEKNNAAISMKIDPQTVTIILDEEYEDCTLDDLQEELPGCKPELQMMYAGTKTALVREAEMTKGRQTRNQCLQVSAEAQQSVISDGTRENSRRQIPGRYSKLGGELIAGARSGAVMVSCRDGGPTLSSKFPPTI
ncbi:hypothetical protein Bbelb_395460 [Branchiostoma belcheri]|nr:hypothetical protein Bbelb_395460 [Branchiostoma belcheri]